MARIDGEDVGAHRLDLLLHGLLGASAECHHGDDRGHADDDAERRKDRAQGVGADGLQRHQERLAHMHGQGLPGVAEDDLLPLWFWELIPGMPPPPVIRCTRWVNSFWAWTRLALGRSRTESCSVSPLVTSL